jgi:hypothetical protein
VPVPFDAAAHRVRSENSIEGEASNIPEGCERRLAPHEPLIRQCAPGNQEGHIELPGLLARLRVVNEKFGAALLQRESGPTAEEMHAEHERCRALVTRPWR